VFLKWKNQLGTGQSPTNTPRLPPQTLDRQMIHEKEEDGKNRA